MSDTKAIKAALLEAGKSSFFEASPADDLLMQLEFVADLMQRAPQPLPPRALIFPEKDHSVRVVPIERKIRIGRSPECELSFPELREVSRFHCEIVPGDEACVLRDLGSYNGTRVKGQSSPIKDHELRDGDVIKIASLKFVFLSE